jgi:hypothetical protein
MRVDMPAASGRSVPLPAGFATQVMSQSGRGLAVSSPVFNAADAEPVIFLARPVRLGQDGMLHEGAAQAVIGDDLRKSGECARVGIGNADRKAVDEDAEIRGATVDHPHFLCQALKLVRVKGGNVAGDGRHGGLWKFCHRTAPSCVSKALTLNFGP